MLGLTLAPALVDDPHNFTYVPLIPLTALGMALILFGASLLPQGGSRLLESGWLARAGRIAYPWYLTHVLVLHWLWGELGVRYPAIGSLSARGQLAVLLPLFLAGSVAAALLLHFAVEKPCLLLKDRIGRRRTAPSEIPFSATVA